MKKLNELTYLELKNECNPNMFKFKTTEDLKDLEGVIGQDRGINALEFGLNINIKGYNIFIEGPTGVGKTMYTKKYVDQIAKKKKTPSDWCYIYNFANPNEPVAVPLPSGIGKQFEQDMDEFVKDLKTDIIKTFVNDAFEKEKLLVRQSFDEKRSALLEKLNQSALKQGFEVKTASNGIYIMPILDGKTIDEEEFEKLDSSIKKEFEDKSTIVQEQIVEIMGQIKIVEKEANKKVEEWQTNIALITVNLHINNLKTKYKKYPKITTFFKDIKEDILKNISCFMVDETTPQQNQQINEINRTEISKPWLNYKVNLFIDNSQLSGAPVIMDSNCSYYNMFGKLEYENSFGALKTDYTMIKPGLFHYANGGYIIIQAKDILTNSFVWDTLKKSLRIKELTIDNTREQSSGIPIISIKPEPIPLNIKIILLGNSNIYYGLLACDDDFRKLFRVKVEFEEEAPRDAANILKTAQFIHTFCEREGFPHLDRGAMAKVIEFSSRLTNEQNKLTTQFNELTEIVGEACTWAMLEKAKIVSVDFVEKALAERIVRVKKYDNKYSEMIQTGTVLIRTDGFAVGQINGLSVLKIGDYSFGKPAKITANTYIGKNGIVNIEREVELSGTSHSKGVLILTGYIGEKFAQELPLSLTASICFEQSYNGVDGDSASSTELYALISSLSEIPINQAIAVTGSVNQKGEIQPIGGVNEKIEGFFNICKHRGLNGKHGVMIPVQNKKNLNLSDDVIEAVKNNLFHIYAVSTIDEGIEVLTNVPAGKVDKQGNYPAGSINYLIYEKIKKYAKKSTIKNTL